MDVPGIDRLNSDREQFQKGEEVLYLDKRAGKLLPGVVKDIDFTCQPPSYAVHIPSLDVTRETVGSRLSHLDQMPAGADHPPASAPAAAEAAAPTGSEQQAQPQQQEEQPSHKKKHHHKKKGHGHADKGHDEHDGAKHATRASPRGQKLRYDAPAWPGPH